MIMYEIKLYSNLYSCHKRKYLASNLHVKYHLNYSEYSRPCFRLLKWSKVFEFKARNYWILFED